MASVFKNYITNEVGESNTAVYTAPASAQTTVIGLTMANITNTNLQVSLFLSTDSANGYIVKEATIPAGSALVPIGGAQKFVVEANSVLYAYSNTALGMDVIVSVLELT